MSEVTRTSVFDMNGELARHFQAVHKRGDGTAKSIEPVNQHWRCCVEAMKGESVKWIRSLEVRV